MERGRPRQFDEQQALEAAMRVFWRDGYRGASLAELTAAMGINKPSLYATFGGKEQLYLRALDHYATKHGAAQAEILEGDLPLRDAIGGYLRRAVSSGCDKSSPGGCYVVNALADCGTEATPEMVAEATQAAYRSGHAALKARLQRGLRDGELPKDADVNALANLFNAVLAGLAIMARNGGSKAALNAVVDHVLTALPGA